MKIFSLSSKNTNLITFTSMISVICLIAISAPGLAQTQLGTDINGEAAGDQSGRSGVSLSSDGSRLAIGAVYNIGNGENSGHVRVYQWSDTDWVQLGTDIDGEATGDYSGGSVSLSSSGDRLAIGASGNDGNGEDSGHVRVFQWSGTDWVQLGADIDGEAADDDSGSSVSLSSNGNRLAIGARQNGYNPAYAVQVQANQDESDKVLVNPARSGHVRVYQWSGSDWVQLGADIDGEAEGDYSGRVSLSSDGNHVAIGAQYNDGNGESSGHVRVYQWSGTNWVQLGADIDGEAEGDRSSRSLSVSSDGNRVAIGANNNDGNGTNSGHVRVYQWSGTDWTQLGSDIDGDAAGHYFGQWMSLSSDGNRLVVGTEEDHDNGINAGLGRVFHWSGTDWEQIGEDINGEEAGDLASRVTLSADGNRVAIGARWNDGNGTWSGHVRVFDLSMFNVFNINPGLNDAWYYEPTDGQGFFITVFPDLGYISLAWFTYDTDLPPLDAFANLGDPGHRWLTAVGPIDGDKSVMNIEMTSGGIFDAASIIERTDPAGSDGTIILTFENCNSGTIEYDIPSISRQGIIPIVRVANDNIVICEALK